MISGGPRVCHYWFWFVNLFSKPLLVDQHCQSDYKTSLFASSNRETGQSLELFVYGVESILNQGYYPKFATPGLKSQNIQCCTKYEIAVYI